MILENQTVEIKWNANNIGHYESKGYRFTKTGEPLSVKAEDLTRHSKIKVQVRCDYCGEVILKNFSNYVIEKEKNKIKKSDKDSCKKCSGKKVSENYGTEDISDLELLDEEVSKLKVFTKEFLINEFFRYRQEFGVYPRKIDIDGNKEYPSATSYYKKWGNWNNFLKSLNLIGSVGIYKVDEEVIKDMYPDERNSMRDINNKLIEKVSIYELNKIVKKIGLKERNLLVERTYDLSLPVLEIFKLALTDLELDIGKCPTSIDYDAYTKLNRLPSRKLTERKTGSKYSILCQEIIGESNYSQKSKEILIQELKELAVKLDRVPQANELVHHGLSTRKAYVKEFGMNFLEILKSLGFSPDAMNDRNYFTDDELKDGFMQLKQELGHIPSWHDIDDCVYLPSSKTYSYRFGSLRDFYRLLNLTEIEENQEMSGGFVSRNINGELCRSFPELKISNLLIKNGLIYEDNLKYSKLDATLKNKWTMDWYLVDLNIYVEYFGMYDENQLNKKTITGKYSRKVKRKIKYCQDKQINLIELYVDDLKDGCKGLIEKFSRHDIYLEYQEVANI